MPRYFFHLHNSVEATDYEGRMLPDMKAARKEAIKCAREIIASEIKETGKINLSHWVEIEDEKGIKIPLRFGDCIDVNP